MLIAFYSTSDVFAGEEKLKNVGIECKVVPTPVTDKAYCGVCLETEDIRSKDVLKDIEFNLI